MNIHIHTLIAFLYLIVIPVLFMCIIVVARKMNKPADLNMKWSGDLEVYIFGKGRAVVNSLFPDTLTEYIFLALERLDPPNAGACFAKSNPATWKIESFDRAKKKLAVRLS